MARLRRFCPVGIPQHIIQRGNNRQACFCSTSDFIAYAAWLKEYAQKFDVAIHAWVFMTNHVHLLATPNQENAISKMMQSLGRMYVRYFNKQYARTGTLWESRYKACLVDEDRYLLACYRYIELNPVNAQMVEDPANYYWSSYQCNALGRDSSLLSPHGQYMALGTSPSQRQRIYREMFQDRLGSKMITEICDAVNKGLVLGNGKFKDQIERNFAKRARPAPLGRPKISH